MLLHQLRVRRGRNHQTLTRRTPARCRRRCRGRTVRNRLARLLELPRAGVHGRLDLHQIHLNIVEHALLQRPPEEVQFPDGGLEHLVPLDLKHDSLTPAEGIKQFLTVCLQLRLVVRIDEKLLVVQDIRDIVLLGVVRHKPVNEAQGGIGRALEQLDDVFLVVTGRIELLEAIHNELLLTVNLPATSLRVRVDCYNGKIVHGVLNLNGQKS